jgi:hypothetical protein
MVDALVHGKSLADSAPHWLGIWAWGAGFCLLGFFLARRTHARA